MTDVAASSRTLTTIYQTIRHHISGMTSQVYRNTYGPGGRCPPLCRSTSRYCNTKMAVVSKIVAIVHVASKYDANLCEPYRLSNTLQWMYAHKLSKEQCNILGSNGNVQSGPLGCNTMWSHHFLSSHFLWTIPTGSDLILSSCNLQWSYPATCLYSISYHICNLPTSTLNMKAAWSSNTQVHNDTTTWCHNSEDQPEEDK